VCIRIIALSHDNDRGFDPFVARFIAYVLAMWYHIKILITGEKVRKLLVYIPSSIEARIHNDGILVNVPPQRFLNHDSHAGIIHGPHVHITDLACGELFCLCPAVPYPPFVQQLVLSLK